MVYIRFLTMAARISLPIAAYFILLSLLPSRSSEGGENHYLVSLCTIFFAAIIFGFLFWTRRFDQHIVTGLETASGKFASWIDGLPLKRIAVAVILLSGYSLFQELVLIRWQADLFSVFAFYKNFTLLACFCGLGIGYALADRKPLLFPLYLPALTLNIFMMLVLHYGGNSATHYFFGLVPVQEEATVSHVHGPGSLLQHILVDIPLYLLLIGTFCLNVLGMIPVTQLCGAMMRRLPVLQSYSLNLAGSIAGVAILFAFSWLWIGPVIWFGLAAMIALGFLLAVGQVWKTDLACLALITVMLSWPVEPMVQNIYSPYQLIQKTAGAEGLLNILAAGTYYQQVVNLAVGQTETASGSVPDHRGYYELPFQTAKSLSSVAVVGAGTGNDVAAALRYNAGSVDAAEIDPVIRDLGIVNHPEQPYQSRRVTSIIGDARAFFRNTPKDYDLIVYGVLDSHILVSHGSNVRVDSFVYTQQGIQDAFDHLKPGGMISLAFCLPTELMGHKVYAMLKALPGAGKPVAILTQYDRRSTVTFMVAKGGEVSLPQAFMAAHHLTDNTAYYANSADAKLDLPTDDWPFFYMDHKMYPTSYVVSLVLVMAVALYMMRSFLPGQTLSRAMMPFFFLGAGFMLVETKAITELALLFGNTWWVVAITIIAVLIMSFIANLAVMKLRFKSTALPYAFLLALIAVGFWVALHGATGPVSPVHKWLMVLLLVSPLTFAGVVFSTLLKSVNDVPNALAYNLTGAMLGGLLEYNSMQFGFAALYLIGFALYALAWITTRRPAPAG